MTLTPYNTTGIETLSLRGERRGVWHVDHIDEAKIAARNSLAHWTPKLQMVTYSDEDFDAVASLAKYQGFDDNTISFTACAMYW